MTVNRAISIFADFGIKAALAGANTMKMPGLKDTSSACGATRAAGKCS